MGWLFGRRRKRCEYPMAISFEDCFSQVLALGVTGSGKTTAMANVAIGFLSHGSKPGAVWCCTKADEADRAIAIAERAGRAGDVLIFGPDSGHSLDLMGCILNRRGGSVEAAAQFYDRLGAVGTRNSGRSGEKLWDEYRGVMLRHGIDLVRLAGDRPSVSLVYQAITGAPVDFAQVASNRWWQQSACALLIQQAQARDRDGLLTAIDQAALAQCIGYFLETFPGLGDRFAGSVMGTTVSSLMPFLVRPFSEVFDNGHTTLPPEEVLRGKIIILDWPILVHDAPGAVAQAAFVQLVQQLCMSRPEGCNRSVAIFRDEAHFLVHPEWDAKIMTVARSHGLAHFDYVQNLPTMQSAFSGGPRGEQEAAMFIAAHMNIFLFANNCKFTNAHFSELLGVGRTMLFGYQQHPNPQPGLLDSLLGCDMRPSVSFNQSLFPEVPAEAFGMLRKGGTHNGFLVDAILYQAGRVFGNGKVFTPITFPQVLS